MTTLEAVSSDSLVIDAAAVATGLRTYRDNRDGLLAYVNAVLAVPLGEQVVYIDGQPAAKYDVLHKLPEVHSAIREAQYHAHSMKECADTLHLWASGGSGEMVGLVKPPLVRMREILQALPSGATLTEAQSQELTEKMATARVYSQLICRSFVLPIQTRIHNFLTNLTTDYDTFAHKQPLQQAIRDVQRTATEDALPYLPYPATRGIGETFLQIGRIRIEQIQKVADALDGAMKGHEEVRSGAGALATAIESAESKYEAAFSAMARADREGRSALLRRLDLTTAISSWDQFDEFFRKSGI